MFVSFTSTQALLNALGAACSVHMVDLDVGFSGRWPPTPSTRVAGAATNASNGERPALVDGRPSVGPEKIRGRIAWNGGALGSPSGYVLIIDYEEKPLAWLT
jgi:hypothetical protein